MPKKLHEYLSWNIAVRIDRWLESLRIGRGLFANIANKIEITGAPSLKVDVLREKPDTKGPDASFTYNDCGDPGLVIEVSYSQPAADVSKKARAYILGTKGVIRTVVHIDANDIYQNKGLSARFSVWRADFTSVKDQEHVGIVESVTGVVILSLLGAISRR